MREVVAQAKARFGVLHGVIHAVGVPGGGLIQLKTREAAEAVLAPKVQGTRVLAAALEGERLDFLVACSSLTSVVGRLGQVDYTAANAFLDSFLRAWQARTGTPAVSVNWGAWDEVGMAALSGAAGHDEGKPFDHPLLQRCLVDTPKRLVFSTRFDIHTQWVVDEHRIVGNPAVPGVTYFEMVRAALADRAIGRPLELHDVFFLAPVRVPEDGSREIQLVLDEEGDGYRWTARSVSEGGQSTDHIIGRARFGAPAAPRTVDLEELRRRCDRPEAASFEVEHEEDLGPRWRSVRNIHLGNGELLLVLEMPSEFAADFEKLKLHPALLDRASGMAKGSLGERGFYLPLGYGSLRIHGELPPRLYCHARFRDEKSLDRETMAFDLTLMDERGQVRVEAERLMQKRVKDPGAEIRNLANLAQAEQALAAPERQEILPTEGVQALERILAARVTSQVVVSVRDLQATLERTDEVVRERVLEAASQMRSAGDLQPRPSLKTPYVAPRNELEEKIASAWQQVLGIDRIGVDDNFFDLGGDSVQAIQIIAKGNQMGLQLNPQQFFQYSTVAELAEMLGGMKSRQAEQEPVVGPAPLTADERRFFELHGRAAVQGSRAVRLDADGRLDAAALRQVLTGLRTHHDALRLRFTRGLQGWLQTGTPPGDEVPLLEVDLGATPPSEAGAAIAAAEEKLRARLELSEGRLLAAALLRHGAGTADSLLVVGHALALDGTSWRLLAEDLAAALRRKVGEALRPKTMPFKRWAERLAEEASAEALRKEGALWLEGPWSAAARLPTGAAPSGPGGVRAHQVSLPAGDTQHLLERATTTYRADLPTALLTALARTLVAWVGQSPLAVDVISDGRESFDGLDFSRTVGCFDVTWPLLLDVAVSSSATETLKRVKEQVRRIPRQGIGYGLLLEGQHAELAEKVRHLPRPEVAFRHLGTFWEATPGAGAFEVIDVGASGARLPAGRRLEVESFTLRGQLNVRLRYDAATLSEATVAQLGEDILQALRSLKAEGQDARSTLSAVDFPLAGLDDSQLGALAALIDEADRSDR